jgi:hypothetical protein
MEDKELLRLAAKAAGYPIHSDAKWVGAGGGKPSLYMGERGPKWNPLEDDGDALKLACTLRFNIEINEDWIVVITCEPDASAEVPVNFGDVATATRRAITVAAAEIGKVTE